MFGEKISIESMKSNEPIIIRSIKDGPWYWINKKLLQDFGKILSPSGIAVYNVLAKYSNSSTQSCFPSQKKIADEIGISRKTVREKIKEIEKLGLLHIKRKRGACIYTLLRIGASCATGWNESSLKGESRGYTKENKGNIYNNDNREFKNSFIQNKNKFIPKTRDDILALDLAKSLNDMDGLPFYRSIAQKHSGSLLRKILGEVREIPSHKIKKSRKSYFNYLIRKYEKGFH